MLIHGNSNNIPLEDNSIDLIVTDPPYGISFMGKDWDKALPSQQAWKECFRVLKEGKLAFVMCSPRQDVLARMIIDLEDAGFKTGYTSIYWTYASGFPKAANISKLIDKKNGATREIIGKRTDGRYKYKPSNTLNTRNRNLAPEFYKTHQAAGYHHHEKVGLITKPATPEAKAMEGAYVGFQPKPAVEIILVVSKGKTLTWLDDCRIPYNIKTDEQPRIRQDKTRTSHGNIGNNNEIFGKGIGKFNDAPYFNQKGRFPANLLVSDDILNDGKNYKTGNIKPYIDNSKIFYKQLANRKDKLRNKNHNGSEGSYSRYFSLDKWYTELQLRELQYTINTQQYQKKDRFPFIITPKASKSERNEGCEDLPEKRMLGYGYKPGENNPANGMFDGRTTVKNNYHPTVKPIKLMSYLITLGSRENDLVLDPFVGSGTTYKACLQTHRRCIGIEINKEYIEIAKARIKPLIQQTTLV